MTDGMKFTASQVSAFRLARHHLANKDRTGLVRVCRDVCGIQAQLMSAAEMALWARDHAILKADIDSALWKKRSIVRTSLMRQTLHLIPSADFFFYITALRKSRLDALMRNMSKFGITMKNIETLNESILSLLRGGPMSQRDMTEALLQQVGTGIRKYVKVAWGIQLFRPALVEGLICCGPQRGKESTYIRVDQWLPKHKNISELEAKRRLLRRYLAAYAPATQQDFSKWSGISMNEVKDAWQSLKEELVEVFVGERKGSLLRHDLGILSRSEFRKPVVRLLPSFDPYLLGHVEKSYFVGDRHYKRVFRNQGWISPVVLLNGNIIGVWSSKCREKESVLEVMPFRNFSRAVRSRIEKEAAGAGRFLETTFQMRYTGS